MNIAGQFGDAPHEPARLRHPGGEIGGRVLVCAHPGSVAVGGSERSARRFVGRERRSLRVRERGRERLQRCGFLPRERNAIRVSVPFAGQTWTRFTTRPASGTPAADSRASMSSA